MPTSPTGSPIRRAASSGSLPATSLRRCLERLEPDRRGMVLLAYCHGWSREELAQPLRPPGGDGEDNHQAKPDHPEGMPRWRTLTETSSAPWRANMCSARFRPTSIVRPRHAMPPIRSFRRAVSAWEIRLQPLADGGRRGAGPRRPLDRVLAGIDARRASRGEAGDNVVALRRSVRRWQDDLGARRRRRRSARRRGRRRSPAARAADRIRRRADRRGRQVAGLRRDRRRGARAPFRFAAWCSAAPADKSYELWSIAPNEAPKSLGVRRAGEASRATSAGRRPPATSRSPSASSRRAARRPAPRPARWSSPARWSPTGGIGTNRLPDGCKRGGTATAPTLRPPRHCLRCGRDATIPGWSNSDICVPLGQAREQMWESKDHYLII